MMLTPKQAAVYLGTSLRTLRRMIAAGQIRYHQPSLHARIRFKEEWLEEYVERGTVETGSANGKRSRKPPPAPQVVGPIDLSFLAIGARDFTAAQSGSS